MQPHRLAPRALLPVLLFVLGTHAAFNNPSKQATTLQMCFPPYNLTTTGVPVTGSTIKGYQCDAQGVPITSQPSVGLFSFITTPPICTAAVIGNQPGQYEAFVTAMVTFGESRIAYDFTRTTIISGTGPCAIDGVPTGTCRCELEPEVNVITGTRGKIKEKMIKDLQYEFTIDPSTLQRLGAVMTLTYKNKGPSWEALLAK